MKKEMNRVNADSQRVPQHVLRLCLLPLLLAVALVGCRPEGKAPAEIDPTGVYALVSVNGKELPCTLSHEGATPTIRSGVFTINADGTCSSKIVFSMPSGGDSTREVKASYTRQGSTLTMKWEGAGMTTGTVTNNTFTMDNEGMIFAYRR